MSQWRLKGRVAVCLALAFAAPVRADVLYVLNTHGWLRAVDPATGTTLHGAQLALPGKVVSYGRGLGRGDDGVVYGLVGVADDCASDPTRTVFVPGGDYGCNYTNGQDACEQAFVVTWNGPMSCTWSDNQGCEACGDCLNTCAPPPACEGSSRTQWLGFGGASCRALDGEPAACAGAYYSDVHGVWSCFESAGQCLACDAAAQAAGSCTAGCAPARTCADPSRDLYAGIEGCEQLSSDSEACLRAFESDRWTGAARPCVAAEEYCFGCSPGAEADGHCIDTCAAGIPCPGDPGRLRVSLCHALTDAGDCENAYTVEAGEPTSCFFNENAVCLPCAAQQERAGACAETCVPPVCSADDARSVLVSSADACHSMDANPQACGKAFFVGRCGVSSCHYDAEAGSCRPCTVDDPGRCENACGAFEGLEPARTPQLVTVDPASAAVTVVGSPGDWFEHPVPAEGGVYVLAQFGACAEPRGVFRLDPGDQRPALLEPLTLSGGSALARHPGDGLLYRLGPGGLFATDPLTGITTPLPVDAPIWLEPRAMAWAPACNAFLVADGSDGLWVLDPATGSVARVVFRLTGECDEGDCTVGIIADGGDVCPPVVPSTTTTTITTTSTSSSTSSTTMPSELLSGRRLLLTDGAKPKKRRLELRSDDPTISLGGGEGSADDPAVHGGTLRVVATSGAFATTYVLTGEGWRHLRKAGRLVGYEWRGRDALRKVVLRPGRLDVRGQGAGLVQTLFTDPGAVQVVLQLGSRRWCVEFGGTFEARTARKLRARDAPAPLVCAAP